jgi:hypothetical protein
MDQAVHLTDNQTKVLDSLPHDGAVTPAGVAEATGLGYSTVTRLLRELADGGLAAKHAEGWHRTDATSSRQAVAESPNADTGPIDHPAPHVPPATERLPEPAADNTIVEAAAAAEAAEPLIGAGQSAILEPDAALEPATVTASAADPAATTVSCPPAVASPAGGDPSVDAGSSDGDDASPRAPRLRNGQLRDQVLAALRGAEEPLGPAQLAKVLQGKSQGAISNACDRLVSEGRAVLTNEKPRRFAATPTA